MVGEIKKRIKKKQAIIFFGVYEERFMISVPSVDEMFLAEL